MNAHLTPSAPVALPAGNHPASTPPGSPPLPSAPPPLAQRLGYAGLAVFVLGTALVWLVRPDAHPYVVDALAKFAGAVVAFLGAVHWGLAMRDADQADQTRRLAWSVVPTGVAWVAMVMPPYAGLVILGAMLLGCYAVDRLTYPRHGLAGWLTLRFRLSAGAALACFLAAAGS